MEYLINGNLVKANEWAIRLAQALKKTNYMKENFNEFLSNEYGFINVEGVKYYADMFLEQVAPSQYDKIFNDFCEKESFTIVEWNDEYNAIVMGDYFVAREGK